MRTSDDLFSNIKYPPIGAQPPSDGGHYYRNDSSNPPELLAAHKRIEVYVGDYDKFFYAAVAVNEVVVLPKKHSSGKRPRSRQLTRTAWAWVAPIDDYITIGAAVHDVTAKLRENWARRYQAELNAIPLEDLIALALFP